MYTHLELSSQWRLIHMEKRRRRRRKRGQPFFDVQYLVCVGRTSGGSTQVACIYRSEVMCVCVCVCREVGRDFKCIGWWTYANSWPLHVICSELIIAVETRSKRSSLSVELKEDYISYIQYPSNLSPPAPVTAILHLFGQVAAPLSTPILSVSLWRTLAERCTT